MLVTEAPRTQGVGEYGMFLVRGASLSRGGPYAFREAWSPPADQRFVDHGVAAAHVADDGLAHELP